MSIIPFYHRSDTPDLDDVTGGPDPVPAPIDGEHVEHVRRAYHHAVKCTRHLERALDLLGEGPLDDEPMMDGDDDVAPVEFDPAVDDNPEGERRREMLRHYAQTVRGVAPNI